jgi:hypothetical protein
MAEFSRPVARDEFLLPDEAAKIIIHPIIHVMHSFTDYKTDVAKAAFLGGFAGGHSIPMRKMADWIEQHGVEKVRRAIIDKEKEIARTVGMIHVLNEPGAKPFVPPRDVGELIQEALDNA